MSVPSEAEIKTLMQSSYSPSQVGPLEDYVDAISAGNAPYMFDAVRTLVKLYLLFPATYNTSKVSRCFLLAMAQYPGTDLLALTYMVPNAPGAILQCGDLLDACQFQDFWKLYDALPSTDPDLAPIVASSRVQLQRAVLSVLALTYQSAPASIVLSCCNSSSVKDAEATFLKSHPAVESVASDRVVFKPTTDNSKRQRVFQEGISYPALARQLYGQ